MSKNKFEYWLYSDGTDQGSFEDFNAAEKALNNLYYNGEITVWDNVNHEIVKQMGTPDQIAEWEQFLFNEHQISKVPTQGDAYEPDRITNFVHGDLLSSGVPSYEDVIHMDEDKPSDAINPKHYQDVVPGMQYMKCMEYMLEGKVGVEAHLLGQVYKYLMRLGKKDPKEQDAGKAKWYLDCLTKYYKTDTVDTDNNG